MQMRAISQLASDGGNQAAGLASRPFGGILAISSPQPSKQYKNFLKSAMLASNSNVQT